MNGVLSYLLSDPVLGSASAAVNTTSGQVTATQLYSPYGAVRYSSGILPTDYGFTHQRTDATSGLDDYGARSYDPLAGQFTSADTTLAGGLNLYGYVAGNPETFVDPSGHVQAPDENWAPFQEAPTNAGTLPPAVVGAIGAAVTAFLGGAWLWGQLHQSIAHSSAPVASVVAARHQTNDMALENLPASSPMAGVNTGVWSAHGVLPGFVGGGSGTSDGGGGVAGSSPTNSGGGGGTAPRLPPPTENGEAVGAGAPILSESVVPECDPQLALEALCIGWMRWQSALSDVPDPEPQYDAQGRPIRGRGSPGAWINVEGPDGSIETVPAGPTTGVHAEDNAQAAVPGGRMSRAFGWRGASPGTWTERPICVACQAKYPANLFPPGVQADPGGAWGR